MIEHVVREAITAVRKDHEGDAIIGALDSLDVVEMLVTLEELLVEEGVEVELLGNPDVVDHLTDVHSLAGFLEGLR